MSLLSAMLTLFLVMDPLGNIPLFLVLLEDVTPERRRRILLRESTIALGFLIAFLFAGPYILGFLQISRPALGIAGGLVLFLISLRMIFPVPGGMFGPTPEGEPFIVPIAIPLIAGPSAIATVMLFATRNRALWEWVVAILGAWAVSTLILLASTFLRRVLRRRGLIAIERLMGMILLTVAVQMLLSEISGLFAR
ncbi:MarC family protein [Candidatus Bipolaricaulota bacterium]|nr:MarC family protein [Candidatus Bipolaricaulota bacterium]HHR85358.1 MarC family protein [Candidatus Acetothermia bacterium]